MHDLADHLGARGARAQVWTTRTVLKARAPLLLIASQPDVIALPRDAVIAASPADVAADFPRVPDDRQAPGRGPRSLSVGHSDPLLLRRPQCQRRPSVLDRWAERCVSSADGGLMSQVIVDTQAGEGVSRWAWAGTWSTRSCARGAVRANSHESMVSHAAGSTSSSPAIARAGTRRSSRARTVRARARTRSGRRSWRRSCGCAVSWWPEATTLALRPSRIISPLG